jgi:hypothetical protein
MPPMTKEKVNMYKKWKRDLDEEFPSLKMTRKDEQNSYFWDTLVPIFGLLALTYFIIHLAIFIL